MSIKRITAIVPIQILDSLEKRLRECSVPGVTVEHVKGYGQHPNYFRRDLMQDNARIVLYIDKARDGDRDVGIEVPSLEPWREHTPVLVDDIISTARTMIETIGHLMHAGFAAPICIGIHALFAGDAYEGLKSAGAADIVTCNTVRHPSNAIDLTQTLAEGVRALFEANTAALDIQENTS